MCANLRYSSKDNIDRGFVITNERLATSNLADLIRFYHRLLSVGALFTHADFALPPALDRRLRWLLVGLGL